MLQHESPWMPVLWILLVLAVCGLLLFYNVYLLTYAMVGIGVLLGLAALLVVVYTVFWLLRNRVSPITRVQARVLRRRKKDWDVSIIGDTPESAAARLGMMGRQRNDARKAYSRQMARGQVPEIELAGGTNYLVTFDAGGQETEFSVSEEYYVKCTEQTEGLLVYRGEQFMQFIPDVS